jgi:5-methylcytosine-specific restriction endonuclease McrA
MSNTIFPQEESVIKRCSKCQRELPLSEFRRNSPPKQGYRTRCRACENEINRQRAADGVGAEHTRRYRERHKEILAERRQNISPEKKAAQAEYQRQHYQANKERIAERNKRHYQDNKERKSTYGKEYYQQNREKVLARTGQRQRENRETYAAYTYKWRIKNPEYARSIMHKRRASGHGADEHFSRHDITVLFALQKTKCAICHVSIKHAYHIDHIVPLSLGGTNGKHNIQLLCPPCNLKKNDCHPVDYMQKQGYLL